ncbi:AAA family ATPase [Streptomyces sp. NPDC090022]|uniref:helix-turn-helix transcriptional regulator n=1 Tax=Streptomyces sp. NPDC090022 TaxID=3365920 RepID=UPI0037FD26F0
MTTGPGPSSEEPDGGPTPLRGRAAEQSFIEARLDALGRGAGGIVRIEGPAGIGTSRMLAAASASARRRGIRVFHGGVDPDAPPVPLGPLLEGLLAGPEPLADADRLRDLATVPGQRFWLLRELADRLREAARDRPLLIVLDDFQWCDDLTLLTLGTVVTELAPHAILWLVAVRGAVVPPGVRTTLDRMRRAGAHELVLGPLTDRASARIAEDVLGAVPGPDVLGLVRTAGGVPALLVELLGAVREEEAVTIENGTAALTAGAFPVPPLPSVARRLDRLSAAARELVETAAAVGAPVTVARLAELLGRSPAALITAVREALDAELLTEQGDFLAFGHDLVRRAVAAGLPPSVRQSLYRHAADEPGGGAPAAGPRGGAAPADNPPAPQAGQGRPGDGRGESDRLRTAAAELASTAPAAAAELALRALDGIAADAPERPRLVAETIPLLWQAGRPARARDLGASALASREPGGDAPAAAPGAEDEARIRLALARLSSQFDFTETVRQARTGAALPGLPADLRARLLALACLGLAMSGENEAAERALPAALAAAGEAGDRTAEATLAVVESAVRFARSDWADALRRADRATALAAGLGIVHSLWVPEALWHGFLLNLAGRSRAALAVADSGVRGSRNQGQAATTCLWLMNRTRALLDAGRLADARADAEAAAALTDELGLGDFADLTLRYAMTRVALHTGDRAAARTCAAEARRMRAGGPPLVRTAGSWLLALLADAEGRPDRALAALDELLPAPGAQRPAPDPDTPSPTAPGPLLTAPLDPADTPVLVRIALRAGALERAVPAVHAAERRAADNPGIPLLAAGAAHARGLLDNDLGHLVRAVRLYEDCPRPIARASALEDAGRRLAATRLSDAVPYLESALALYTRAGADRDAARVRRRLRAAGIRRRPSTAGHDKEWPELTGAELRVARLVAQGLTNAQVAEHLSLSPHTVGSHLRRAFTKLDLTSRADLARLVTTRDDGA